jgi:predicted GIY-YIG superfamily endonuclease
MIYIGQTDNFKERMARHQADLTHCMHRYGPAFARVEVIQNEQERRNRETALIHEYRPPCNGAG